MPYTSLSHVQVKPHYRPRPVAGRHLDLPLARSPGKFQGELRISEPVWDLTLESGDGIGDVEAFGYFSLVDLGPDAVDDVAQQARESDITLTADERFFIASQAGAIVSEDSSGFVYVEYFDDKAVLDQRWAAIEADWEEFTVEQDEAEAEEFEDDDGGYVTPRNDPTMPGGGPPVYHGPEERWGG